jgi:hypothetical protein
MYRLFQKTIPKGIRTFGTQKDKVITNTNARIHPPHTPLSREQKEEKLKETFGKLINQKRQQTGLANSRSYKKTSPM